MSDSLPFVKAVVEECSLFFYTLHCFCNKYTEKLNKRLGSHSKLNIKMRAEEFLKFDKAPTKPKKQKAQSPYIIYCKEQAKELKQKPEFANCDMAKLSKHISMKWRHLNAEEKEAYKEKWVKANKEASDAHSENNEKDGKDAGKGKDHNKKKALAIVDHLLEGSLTEERKSKKIRKSMNSGVKNLTINRSGRNKKENSESDEAIDLPAFSQSSIKSSEKAKRKRN